jgi:hypothetical protein
VRWSSPTTAEGQEAPVTVRLLTTEEVAARFRTSPATVRYWRHVGIGPAASASAPRVLYDELEVDRCWELKVGGDKATRAHS